MNYQTVDVGNVSTAVARARKQLIVDHRKGRPVYSTNPSAKAPQDVGHLKPKKHGGVERGFMVNHASGEMKIGGAAFYTVERVDDERFVKLFLQGVQKAADLTKSGLAMFGVVYEMMRQNPNTDKVELVFYTASQVQPKLTERTFRRGLSELLKHNFVFDSPVPGVYFVNITFMYNGDRLALMKIYERESSVGRHQSQLPFDEPTETPEQGNGFVSGSLYIREESPTPARETASAVRGQPADTHVRPHERRA